MALPESAKTNVYAADWLLIGIFLNPTASVPSTVQLLKVPLVGVPSKGVVSVGEVANTKAPVPVSPVTAEAKFAEEGVPRNVATPAPRDVIPVPPLATAKVPANVIVPDVEIGPPDVVKPVVPPDTSTLVTVPPVPVALIV